MGQAKAELEIEEAPQIQINKDICERFTIVIQEVVRYGPQT